MAVGNVGPAGDGDICRCTYQQDTLVTETERLIGVNSCSGSEKISGEWYSHGDLVPRGAEPWGVAPHTPGVDALTSHGSQ